MVKVVWTNHAYLDLQDIYTFIAKDSRNYAFNQIHRLKNRTYVLSKNPLLGRIVPELNQPMIRELIEGNYRIIYRIKDIKRLDILTIYHSSRILNINRLL